MGYFGKNRVKTALKMELRRCWRKGLNTQLHLRSK